jgi:hypothetical protein
MSWFAVTALLLSAVGGVIEPSGVFGRSEGSAVVLDDAAAQPQEFETPAAATAAATTTTTTTVPAAPPAAAPVRFIHRGCTLPGGAGYGGKPAPSPRQVVIGVATGYAWSPWLRIFVRSLRTSGYLGDIVLGVTQGIDAHTLQMLKDNCVTAIDADLQEVLLPRMPVASQRFVWYKRWLDALHYDPDARVLIIDVRDSMFQRAPFGDFERYVKPPVDLLFFEDLLLMKSNPTDADFHTYLTEEDAISKKKCFPGTNAALRKFPPTMRMLCSGSTMGTAKGVDRYLRAMVRAFKQLNCWGNHGIDQGYHHWIFIDGQLGAGLKVMRVGEGPLMTLGATGDHSKLIVPSERRVLVRRDLDGFLLNDDGVVVPTVHQYDRFGTFFHPMLTEWLAERAKTPLTEEQLRALGEPRKVYIGWYDKCSYCSAGIPGCFAPRKRFGDDGKLELTFSAGTLCHGTAVSKQKKGIDAQFVAWNECREAHWCKADYERVKAGKGFHQWW